MISKQQVAKERQGYEAKPVVRVCKNCRELEMREEKKTPEWRAEYEARSFPFCRIGDFSVKMMGVCRQFRAKEA